MCVLGCAHTLIAIMTNTLKCNNCNIVVDELLAYVQNKISIIDEESLVQICVSAFQSEEIDRSKELLFESLPSASRKPARKGQGKEIRVITDIIGTFKSVDPDLIPVFVARNLEKLPPITFDHLDVSELLKKLALVQNEMKEVKSQYVTKAELDVVKAEIVEMKANASSTMRPCENENVNTRRGAYKDSNSMSASFFADSTKFKSLDFGGASSPTSEKKEEGNSCVPPIEPAGSCQKVASECAGETGATTAAGPSGDKVKIVETESRIATSSPYPPSQSASNESSAASDSKQTMANALKNVLKTNQGDGWQVVQPRKRPMRYHIGGKMGTSNDTVVKFKAAERKVPIFITNIHKDTEEKDIMEYIKEKTGEIVKLQRIYSKHQQSYSAFKFVVLESKVDLYLDEKLWPRGIIFRRFIHYKPSSTTGPVGTSDGPSTSK